MESNKIVEIKVWYGDLFNDQTAWNICQYGIYIELYEIDNCKD